MTGSIENMINDPWYLKLNEIYGPAFCEDAGYFDEYKSWNEKYSDWFILPKNKTVIQYSGAFYPFHEGHLSIIKSAIDEVVTRTGVNGGILVLHIDHHGYRKTKGKYSEEEFNESFNLIKNFLPYKGFKLLLVNEDNMDNSCSRNFTRLYTELSNKNDKVYFLCGGDRANFCLTFVDDGNCIVAGRSDNSNFILFEHFFNHQDNIWFIEGNHPLSSTKIRNGA